MFLLLKGEINKMKKIMIILNIILLILGILMLIQAIFIPTSTLSFVLKIIIGIFDIFWSSIVLFLIIPNEY